MHDHDIAAYDVHINTANFPLLTAFSSRVNNAHGYLNVMLARAISLSPSS